MSDTVREKVLIIVPSLQLGGQEHIAVSTASALMKNFDVTLMIFDCTGKVYDPCCETVDINVPANANRVIKVVNVLRRVARLNRYIRKSGTGFILSFGETANIVNALSHGPVKKVASIRGYSSVSSDKLTKLVFQRCDIVTGCSQTICDDLKKVYPKQAEKIKCLYNPLDIDKVTEMGREQVDDHIFSAFTIVSQGRLEFVKNYQRLIKAFYLVQKEKENTNLLIIGDGSEKNRLQQLSSDLGISDKVCFAGYQKNPFSYLSRSSLYVLSSFSEGFPNSLIEAMAFLPIVAVDCKSGPREIMKATDAHFEEGYQITDFGILVKDATRREFSTDIDQDDVDLAGGILEMINNQELLVKSRENANSRCRDFSTDDYCSKLTAILRG